MKYVVCYSGGHSSALAAVETVRKYGRNKVILLNHNISSEVESKEIKQFRKKVADHLCLPIVQADCEGYEQRTPLSLCLEHGILKFRAGNEICTYYLKTQPFYKWLKENYPVPRGQLSKEITLVYGFDSSEERRIIRRRKHLLQIGYESVYPLAEWPRTIHQIEDLGEHIQRPSLYAQCKHANCIGCLKAGKQHWYKVYCCHREIFEQGKYVEWKIGYSILKGAYLSELEPEFERMRQEGIPATENMETQWFWRYARQ